MTIKNAYKNYLSVLTEIESYGTSYDIYSNNLFLLMNSSSVKDFLYRYNLIQDSGMNTIDLPSLIFNSRFQKEFDLEFLILSAINEATEYVENELDTIKEETKSTNY
jgi:hypothetical protein